MKNDLYLFAILEHVPRLLGYIDRDPLSPTYGCVDRQYWHYHIVDTPSVRLQELCLTLSLLYTIHHPQNVYFAQPKIKKWSIGMMLYWVSMQKKDGSFDEWYPEEKSMVATAFSVYAVSESMLLLQYTHPSLKNAMIKAGEWLIKMNDFDACNQFAGVCLALWNIYEVTGEERFKHAAEQKIKVLLKKQSEEGWFPEYGGADMGYSTVLFDYLGKLYEKSRFSMLVQPLKKLSQFLETCQHPDGSIGGEYGSRNTEYVIPHGFLIMQSLDPHAKMFIDRYTHWLSTHTITFDDRYLCQNGYTYLQASQYKVKTGNVLSKQLAITHYKEAGLYITSNKKYFCIVNYKKGGVIQVFDQKSKTCIFKHSGVMVELASGKQYTDQHMSAGRLKLLQSKTLEIENKCTRISRISATPLKQIALRTFQLIGSYIPGFSTIQKKLLRFVLITRSSKSNLNTRKIFIFKKDHVHLHIQLKKNAQHINRIELFHSASFLYVPSSRYFSTNELRTTTHNQVQVRKHPQKLSWEIHISF